MDAHEVLAFAFPGLHQSWVRYLHDAEFHALVEMLGNVLDENAELKARLAGAREFAEQGFNRPDLVAQAQDATARAYEEQGWRGAWGERRTEEREWGGHRLHRHIPGGPLWTCHRCLLPFHPALVAQAPEPPPCVGRPR